MVNLEANKNIEPITMFDPENTMAAVKDPPYACNNAPAIGPPVKDLRIGIHK